MASAGLQVSSGPQVAARAERSEGYLAPSCALAGTGRAKGDLAFTGAGVTKGDMANIGASSTASAGHQDAVRPEAQDGRRDITGVLDSHLLGIGEGYGQAAVNLPPDLDQLLQGRCLLPSLQRLPHLVQQLLLAQRIVFFGLKAWGILPKVGGLHSWLTKG